LTASDVTAWLKAAGYVANDGAVPAMRAAATENVLSVGQFAQILYEVLAPLERHRPGQAT
jgi:hypothetical protein